MASKRKGTITLNYNQNSDEDFALCATSKKGAELLGAIYDLWERRKLDMRYQELDEVISLGVRTHVPEKWILIDVETGQVYQGTQFGTLLELTAREKGEARR